MKITNAVRVEFTMKDKETLMNAYKILRGLYEELGEDKVYQSVITGELIGEVNIPSALGLLSGLLNTAVWEEIK